MSDSEKKFERISIIHQDPKCEGLLVPKFLDVTSDHSLRVAGYCSKCGIELVFEESFVDLNRRCPAPPLAQIAAVDPAVFDGKFLEELKISIPSD